MYLASPLALRWIVVPLYLCFCTTSCRFMFSSLNIIPQHKGVERQIYWRKTASNLPRKLQSLSYSPWRTSDMLSFIGWKQPLNRNFTPQIIQFSFLKVCWPCVLYAYHLKMFGLDYLHSHQVKSTLVLEVFSWKFSLQKRERVVRRQISLSCRRHGQDLTPGCWLIFLEICK